MLQRNESVCLPHMTSENKVQLLSSIFFFLFFCQKQCHYLLMTLIPGKGVKTLQMYRWNPVGIPSITGVEQGLGTDAVQQLCPCGVRGLSNTPHCSGHSHKPILSTPHVAYHRTWIYQLFSFLCVCVCITHLNNILRKR